MNESVKQWAETHGFQEENGVSLERKAWNAKFIITDESILKPPETMDECVVLTVFGSNQREIARIRIEHGLKHMEYVFQVMRLICGKPVVG